MSISSIGLNNPKYLFNLTSMLPNTWSKHWQNFKKKGQFKRIVTYVNTVLSIFNRTSRQKISKCRKDLNKIDPSWGQTGSFLWPEHSLPFGVEISITRILPPRPTHTDCWQVCSFMDAHMLTGYFLVLRTRKSSGPFLLVSMLIL